MERKKNVIAVMSPKGGVGKTSVTANLAAAFALIYDKKVLAVDTNISTASLGLHFDIYFPQHTIHDISKKDGAEKAIHVYHQNLHVLPASIKIRAEEKNINKVRENLAKLIKNYENFLENVSKKYDLVLLDCAPGFDLESIAAMNIAGGLIVVTNPDYPSVVTAVKAIEYARRSKMPVGGIIVNNIKNKKYELHPNDIEKALGIKVIGKIPYDKRIPESIMEKKPVVLFKANSKSSKEFRRIAAGILGENPEQSWFKRYVQKIKKNKNNK